LCSHSRTFQHFMVPKVHYSIHKGTPLVPILSQTNPFNTYHHPIPQRFVLILSTHLRLPSGFPTNKLYTFRFSPIRATRPAHFIFLDLIILITLGEEYKSRSSSICSFLHPPITSSLFGTNILFSTLFSLLVYVLPLMS
jgi:hypothetical protein